MTHGRHIPFSERAFVSVAEAAEYLGPGHRRTTIFALIAAGRIRSVMVGRQRALDVESVLEYATSLKQPGAPIAPEPELAA